MTVYEYKTFVGKVLIYENGHIIKNLENVLNENAKLGYKLIDLHQHVFDGLQFSLVMGREIQ